MKLKLSLTVLCAVAGLLWAAVDLNASQSGVFLPQGAAARIANGFEDIDVRDTDNQPVKNRKAKEDLKGIFQSGLFNLLVNAETFSVSNAISAIRKNINPFAKNICRNTPKVIGQVVSAIVFTAKKLLNSALTALTGLALYKPLAFLILLPMFYLIGAQLRTAPLTIRC